MNVSLVLAISATAAAFLGGFVSLGLVRIPICSLRLAGPLVLAFAVWVVETWIGLGLLSLSVYSAFGFGALAARWLEGYREPRPLLLATLVLLAVPASWVWFFALGLGEFPFYGEFPMATPFTGAFQDSFFLLVSRILALFSLMALVFGTVGVRVAMGSTLTVVLLTALVFGALAVVELGLMPVRSPHGALDAWLWSISEIGSAVTLLCAHIGSLFLALLMLAEP